MNGQAQHCVSHYKVHAGRGGGCKSVQRGSGETYRAAGVAHNAAAREHFTLERAAAGRVSCTFTCAHFQDSPNVFLCSALQVVKAILSSHVCSCCAGGLTLACVCTQPMYMRTNRMSIRYILQHTWAYAWGQEPTLTASIKVDCVNQSCQRQR